VTSSLKGANSPTRGRKLRSTGTKARARVSNGPNPVVELKKQLEERTRELAEARGHLSEALERQAATDEVLGVISSSPGELGPVFNAMLENADTAGRLMSGAVRIICRRPAANVCRASQGDRAVLERARSRQSADRSGIDIVGARHISHRFASVKAL
jgi:hypothetical protein